MCTKSISLVCLVLALTLCSSAAADLAQWESAIGAAGPLHWYKLDEATGTDCADSGSGVLNGAYNEVVLAQDGFFGPATAVGFERNGANRIDFTGATDLSGPWTVEYIVKTTKPPAANDSQALHDSDTSSIRLAGWTALGEAGFTLYGVADYRFTPAAGYTLNDLIVQQDVWMHLTYRNNGSGTQLFFNGKLVGTSNDSVDLPRLRIGGRGAGPADHLQGVMDEAVVFDRAISDTDIIMHSLAASLLDPSVILASDPNPADGAIHADTWVSLTWSPGTFAVSHDVYLGESFDDVNNGSADTFRGNQAATNYIAGFPGFAYPGGLVPGTTYYWRIDEVEADGTVRKGDVWSFFVPPKTAYNPNPADGAKYVTLNTSVSWTGGFGAKLHTVYFGDSFDDVNNAAGGLPQVAATYTPGPLEKDKTYYWRVDEFDAITTYKGNVWSFTTLPDIAVADPALAGWWKFDEGQGTSALDWSGHGNHGKFNGSPQWDEGPDGGALKLDGSSWVDCGNPATLQIVGPLTIACWVNPAQLAGDRGFVALNGSYAFKSNGNHLRFTTPGVLDHDAANAILQTGTWQHVAVTFQPDQVGGAVFYINGIEIERLNASVLNAGSGPFLIGNNQWANQIYRGLIDDVRIYSKVLTAEEIVQAMRGDPMLAWNPSPSNRSTVDINAAVPLSFSPGDNASQHDIYFGTVKNAVADADASDTTGVYRTRQAGTSYNPPEGVEWGGGPYFWRVDEYHTDGTISTGRVWSFTVADYLLVDDFESYNDIDPPDAASNRIFEAWIDGFGTTTNGALVGNDLPPYAERTVVHSGSQSMIYRYDNNLRTSEATLTLSNQRDWTAEGVTRLSLWFRGAAANSAERMYVALNGSAVVYNDDPAATQKGGWNQWIIDLTSFADQGVNLTNVNTITIGIGTKASPAAGGIGTMYFDDLRLYRP